MLIYFQISVNKGISMSTSVSIETVGLYLKYTCFSNGITCFSPVFLHITSSVFFSANQATVLSDCYGKP